MAAPNNTRSHVIVYNAPDWITSEQLRLCAKELGSTEGAYVAHFDEWAKIILVDTSEYDLSYLLGGCH